MQSLSSLVSIMKESICNTTVCGIQNMSQCLLLQIWPQAEYPLMPVGRMVLNKNPKNYFADVEQIAFSPAHMIPGVEASPDKMLQVGACPWKI